MKRVTLYSLTGLFFLLFPLSSAISVLSTRTEMPKLINTGKWFGSDSLHSEDLKNHVVLVHFWSFADAESLRDIPYLCDWRARYESMGLKIIGIHSPGYFFEFFDSNVEAALGILGLKYPNVNDPEFNLWRSFNVTEKPGLFLIAPDESIRERFSGNRDYSVIEKEIQELLKSNGLVPLDESLDMTKLSYPYNDAARTTIELGYKKISSFGNIEKIIASRPQLFKYPETIVDGEFYIDGTWRFEDDRLVSITPDAKLKIQYQSNGFNLVAGTRSSTPVGVGVTINGHPLEKKQQGQDVFLKEGASAISIDRYQLYHIVNEKNSTNDLIELNFKDPGVELFAISLGMIPAVQAAKEENKEEKKTSASAQVTTTIE